MHILRLSDEILDMIMDMLFTFGRQHVVKLVLTCKGMRRHVPPETPGYFPLSLKAREKFPMMFVLHRHKDEFRNIVAPSLLRNHFTPFMRLSEAFETAKRLQREEPAVVYKKRWIVPTCDITSFLKKIICHGHKVQECRPYSCIQDTLLYNYTQADFRENVLDAATLAVCYLVWALPSRISLNDLLLACMHCVHNTNVNLLVQLRGDANLHTEVRQSLEELKKQDTPGQHCAVSACASLARRLLSA